MIGAALGYVLCFCVRLRFNHGSNNLPKQAWTPDPCPLTPGL